LLWWNSYNKYLSKDIKMTQEKINGLPGLYLDFKRFKDGKQVFHQREQGHSWVRNAWVMQLAFMAFCGGDPAANDVGPGKFALKTTSNAVVDESAGTNGQLAIDGSWGYNYNAGKIGGIYAGTGNTAFSVEDYKLAADIAHGTGAGQMEYGAPQTHTKNYNGTSKVWTIGYTRDLNNNSGGSITVAEVGLVLYAELFNTAPAEYLTARDVLETPVTVPTGEILRITYEISMDFSAID
jgi:hypothetical protein